MKKIAFTFLLLLLMTIYAFAGDWHEEFNEICSKVDVADTLSVEELQTLIERSDKLLEQIKASDDSRKKVYIFRLKKCRSMFEYSIQLHE